MSGAAGALKEKGKVKCPAVNTVGNLNGLLDPGESITCSASYLITQADLNAGSVINTAQVHAAGTGSNIDSETVTANQNPALTLVKSATPLTYSSVGQPIAHSYLVTNRGNVSLAGAVAGADDKGAVTGPGGNTVRNPQRMRDPAGATTCSAGVL